MAALKVVFAARPYLWLAAVGSLQMEQLQDPFAEFALPNRVQQL